MEVVLVSLAGCLAGLVVGSASVVVINRLFDMRGLITPGSVLIAALVSVTIGVFFGFYPARKASRLEPIEALRYQ